MDEPRCPRLDCHHKHVDKALQAFGHVVVEQRYEEENVAAPRANEMGVQVGMAIALVNALAKEVEDETDRIKLDHLVSLIQRGAISAIAKTLQRLSGALKKNGKSREDAKEEVLSLARKYDAYYLSDEALKKQEESDVDIILSETFE